MRLPQRQISKQKKLEKYYLDNAFSSDEESGLPLEGEQEKESKNS